ncbi:hypothetical protein QS713_01005 [Gleimia hominis]|uniref:Alpha/beta hydrolase n=1 Tax=Gleimia hominis TaxID=595468 RepID=A0ABU3I8E2_9ACTO|nr:hypothetical protein [Gleimia hominis]MDT3766649.1 hypothetical protein [Gleimia hominis]
MTVVIDSGQTRVNTVSILLAAFTAKTIVAQLQIAKGAISLARIPVQATAMTVPFGSSAAAQLDAANAAIPIAELDEFATNLLYVARIMDTVENQVRGSFEFSRGLAAWLTGDQLRGIETAHLISPAAQVLRPIIDETRRKVALPLGIIAFWQDESKRGDSILTGPFSLKKAGEFLKRGVAEIFSGYYIHSPLLHPRDDVRQSARGIAVIWERLVRATDPNFFPITRIRESSTGEQVHEFDSINTHYGLRDAAVCGMLTNRLSKNSDCVIPVRSLKDKHGKEPGVEVSTPMNSADVLNRVHDLATSTRDENTNTIEILRHNTPGSSRPSWSVNMRGTQTWMVGRNPADGLNDVKIMGGLVTDLEQSVADAMKSAGVQPGDAVEFAGHSQGGMVAASLAGSELMQKKYNVASVIAAGSPIDGIRGLENTPVVSYMNTADLVPALDGRAVHGTNEHIMVHSITQRDYAHSLPGYVEDALEADNKGDVNFDALAQQRRNKLGLREDTVTTAVRFDLDRVKEASK